MADEIIFKLTVDLGDAEKQTDAFQKKLEELSKYMENMYQRASIALPEPSIALPEPPDFEGWALPSLSGMIAKASSLMLSGFGAIFDEIIAIGKKAFTFVYGNIKEVVGDSIDAFATFEKKLGLVSKTTGMTGDELKKLGDELREIARPIGSIKAENLLEIASVAGQLGIKGAENIKAFSKEIAYGVIALDRFGGNAEKLSLHMAKSMNIYQLNSQEVGKMLSVIDALSKATEANELEISNFNMALGQFNTNMKLTYAQATALGATFVASGMQASKAATLYGSGFTNLAKGGTALGAASDALTTAAANGYDSVAKLEKITGQSRDQFTSLGNMIQYSLGVNAYDTLNTINDSLNHIPNTVENINKGISANAYGIEMFGKNAWKAMSILVESMKGVNGEQGEFQTNLELANKAFDEGTSHMESFKRATDTYRERVASLGSIWNDILLTIGEPMVNALNKVLDNAIKIFDQFAAWVGKSDAVDFALKSIAGAFQNIVNNYIVPLANSMLEWITSSQAINQILRDYIPAAMLTIQEWVGAIITKIHEWFDYLVANGESTWEGIKQGLSDAWDLLGKVVKFIKEIPGYIEKITPGTKIVATALADILGIVTNIVNLFTGKNEIIIGFLQSMTDKIYKVEGAYDAAKQASEDYTGMATTGINEVNESIDQMATEIKNANDAVNQLGTDAVYNSVFPDMQVEIAKTEEQINTLDGAIAMMDNGVLALGQNADTTFVNMATQAKQAASEVKAAAAEVDKLITAPQEIVPIKEMRAATVASAESAAAGGYTSSTYVAPSNQVSTTKIAKLAKGVYSNTPYLGIEKDIQQGMQDMEAGLMGSIDSIGKLDTEIQKLGYSFEYPNQSIKDTNAAINQLGNDAVYHSVLPDILSATEQITEATQTMGQTYSQASSNMSGGMKNVITETSRLTTELDAIIGRMRDGQREASALDKIMANVATRQPITTTATNQIVSPTTAAKQISVGEGLGKKSTGTIERTTTSNTAVNINFQGQNIIDESSKNRFAREISKQIKSYSSRSVTAS